MKVRTFIFVLAMLACTALDVFAQDQPLSVETNLVTLNVAVTDKNGNFVPGLTRDDFVLTDEGSGQKIDVFSANDAALSIGIIYDMHDVGDRSASVLEALKRFTSRLGPQDDYFVTLFNEKGSLTADFVPDADQARRHLADPAKGSASSLYDAIIAAGDRTRKLRNAKKYLIVFSDGSDRNSQHSVKDLKLRLRSVNVPIYSLVFTPDDRRQYGYVDMLREGPRQAFRVGETSEPDRSVIAELSGSTGGQSFESSIRNRVYLSALATKFLEEARSQYVIGFYPDVNDGRWRKLSVRVTGEKGKGIRVSSRKGYQSPRAGQL